MPTADELKIIFRTEAQKAIKEMQEVRQKTDDAAGGFSSLSGTAVKLAAAGAGLSIALKGVYSAMSKSIEIYGIQEEADKKLEAVLRATGEAAGYNASELKNMASDLQQVTTIGDETTESAMAVLLTFKQIKNENFERAVNSAQDLSMIFGDLKSSSTMLGKALEDPVQGLSAMRRVGVTFTEEQEKMIKGFAEAGELAEAQGMVLDVLEGQVGGVAKAMRDTATGDLKALNNSLGDLREASGEAALHGLRPIVQWLDDVVGSASDAWKEINKLKQAVAGEITIEEDMIAAQRERVAAAEEALAAAMNYQDEQAAEVRIQKETEALNILLKRLEVEEELGMLELKRGRAQAERDAAEQKALEERYQAVLREQELYQKALDNQDFLDKLYSGTDQGRIDALNEQLEKLDKINWSSFNLAKVEEVRAALLEQINKLMEQDEDPGESKTEEASLLNQLLDEQAEKARNLAEAQEALRQVESLIYAANMDGDEKKIANLNEIRERILEIMEGMSGAGSAQAAWDFSGLVDQIRSELGGATSYIASTVVTAFGGDSDLWGDIAGNIMDGLSGAMDILEDDIADDVGKALSDGLSGALDALEGMGGYMKVAAAVLKIMDLAFDAIKNGGKNSHDPVFSILDAEEQLAEARIALVRETIRAEERMRDEKLSQLEADYDREYQILKDMLDRNLIDHDEFSSRAEALYDQHSGEEAVVNDTADAAIAEQEAAMDLAEAIETTRGEIQAVIDDLANMSFTEVLGSWFTGEADDNIALGQTMLALLKDLDQITSMDQLLDLLDAAGFSVDLGVSPSSSPDLYRSPGSSLSSAPPVTINVTGPVYGIDDLQGQLQAAAERLESRSRL